MLRVPNACGHDGSPVEVTSDPSRPEIVDKSGWVDRSNRVPGTFPCDVVGDSVRKRFVTVTRSVREDKTARVIAVHPVHEEVVGGGHLGSHHKRTEFIDFELVEVIVVSQCV